MTISARAQGTWAVSNATTQAVTIPASGPTSGDMMLCLFTYKASTIPTTPSIDQGWTIIGTYTNGTTAAGNGTGSNQTGAAYKVHTGSESNPTLTFGGTSEPGAAVIVVFQKSADSWLAPVGNGGGITSTSSSYSATNTDPGVTAADMCVAVLGSRDDTAWTVPTFSQTGSTFAAVTVYPTTPIADATSNDISATACYRVVNSGTGSSAVTVTGTLAAVEWASHYFVRLRTGVVLNVSVTAATGTGAAANAATTHGTATTAATGTGTATNPTVTHLEWTWGSYSATFSNATGSALNISVTAATGTGAAANAGKTAGPVPVAATGTGLASNAGKTAGVATTAATGTGAASNAGRTTGPVPVAATGTGLASNAGKTAGVATTAATGTGAATNPAVSLVAALNISVTAATGTGAIVSPAFSVSRSPAVIAATGIGSATL